MAKVMLVEDDNNLREIYEARLLAEGYEIVSAQDGEEALALAVKEKPDLIIADIMMPKISGFDMLDILRSTPETKDTKVIMMTALSQAEDKERANKLGADRYLVKSQVTLEDVARVAREALQGANTAPVTPAAATPTTASSSTPIPVAAPPGTEPQASTPVAPTPAAPPPTPTAVQPAPAQPAAPAVAPVTTTLPLTPPPAEPPSTAPVQLATTPADPAVDLANPTVVAPNPAAPPTPAPLNNDEVLAAAVASVTDSPATQEPSIAKHSMAMASDKVKKPSDDDEDGKKNDDKQTVVHTKVISPINDLSKQAVDLEALVAKEEAKSVQSGTVAPTINQVEVTNDKDEVAAPQVNTIKPTMPPDDPSAIAL
jgi:CheY-like chemotaxis protein